MKKEKIYFTADLQLFSDGAEGGGDSAENSENRAEAVAGPLEDRSEKADGKFFPSENKNSPDDGETQTKPKPKDRVTAFEELIKGEYKDIYDARVQSIIRSRLKNAKAAEEEMKLADPIFELLGKKYNIEKTSSSSDFIKEIAAAAQNDDSLYAEEAEKTGMSVEMIKQSRKAERELNSLKNRLDEMQEEQNRREIFGKWYSEGEQLKTLYPDFDLKKELANRDFFNILQIPGVSVKTAFEIIHKDDIIPAAMQYTAQRVEENIAKKIMSNKIRPSENGLLSNSTTVTKTDVSRLTRAEREELNRRVARGEKITFTK